MIYGKGYKNYVQYDYKPKSSDLICTFSFKPARNKSFKEAAGAIAAESSTGTWTKLTTIDEKKQVKLGAKVFWHGKDKVKIAYPWNYLIPSTRHEPLS
jgi:ribulose-bisphosphate carboxylase large chain